MAITALAAPTTSAAGATVATGAGIAGIAGDPGALYAAADEMTAAAKAYSQAGEAVAAHARAVTANWVGDASDAAGGHIQALAARVHVGYEVYTAAAEAVRTYARALSRAQDAWNAAAERASTASAALDRAHQQASAAAAMPTTNASGQVDPTAQAAQTRAAHDAATAVNNASTALSGAHQDMATAVTDAVAANQHAADAINACCDQLTAVDGEASTPTTAYTGTSAANGTTPSSGKHHESGWDGAIEWAEGAENWLEDNSGTIADVLGTAGLITTFIPGVDVAVTPILFALSASMGVMAAHHAYADGDKAEGDQQMQLAALTVLPDGRMLGETLQAGRALKEADEVADTARATKGVSKDDLAAAGLDPDLPTVVFSRAKGPSLEKNYNDAVEAGQPRRLTRTTAKQADANRRAALSGKDRPPGLSLDEYPFASSEQGGAGASVLAVPKGEQSYQGGVLSRFYSTNNIRPGDDYQVHFGP